MATNSTLNKSFTEQEKSVTIKDFNQGFTLNRKIEIGNLHSVKGKVISDENLRKI